MVTVCNFLFLQSQLVLIVQDPISHKKNFLCRKGSLWQLALTSNLNIESLPLLKTYGFMNVFCNLFIYSSIFYCFEDYYFGFLHPLKVVQVFFQLRLFCTFCFLLNRISWLAQHRRDAVTLFST